MEAPKRATKFAANDEWGKFYRNLFGVAKMNQSLSILTGASAGATEAFVVVPFELVKIRLQGKHRAKPHFKPRSNKLNNRQGASRQLLRPS
jgi:solute carrier family 25 2-oxodicarboxylate transporter 21